MVKVKPLFIIVKVSPKRNGRILKREKERRIFVKLMEQGRGGKMDI